MKTFLITVSFFGLALTIAPSFLVFGGAIPWKTNAYLMFAGMILWFISAPFWLGKKKT